MHAYRGLKVIIVLVQYLIEDSSVVFKQLTKTAAKGCHLYFSFSKLLSLYIPESLTYSSYTLEFEWIIGNRLSFCSLCFLLGENSAVHTGILMQPSLREGEGGRGVLIFLKISRQNILSHIPFV